MSAAGSVGRLHVITDETLQSRFSHAELAGLAARGGADVVQLREKRPMDAAERLALAEAVRSALDGQPTRWLVNDHVEIALRAGAHGVHLGPRDLSPVAARRRLGPSAWIGATANDLETARRLDDEPIDYLGVGPVFGTTSKVNPAPVLGLAGLAAIVATVRHPVIAIGGITPERVAEVLDAGAHGVAVLSAVVSFADPAERTAAFAAALARATRAEARA